jgi:hypothetical protein
MLSRLLANATGSDPFAVVIVKVAVCLSCCEHSQSWVCRAVAAQGYDRYESNANASCFCQNIEKILAILSHD